MADTLQKRLLRMNREILALKSSRTKPASLRAFRAIAQNVVSGSTHTIYFEGNYDFAPIVVNNMFVSLLPFDSATNSQQFISLYGDSTNIYITASRPISRIS